MAREFCTIEDITTKKALIHSPINFTVLIVPCLQERRVTAMKTASSYNKCPFSSSIIIIMNTIYISSFSHKESRVANTSIMEQFLKMYKNSDLRFDRNSIFQLSNA